MQIPPPMHRLAISVMAATLGLGGCAELEIDPGEPGEPTAPDIEGKISTNGLVIDAEILSLLSTAPLARQGSGADPLTLDASAHGALLGSDSGQQLLRYLAICALPEGTQLGYQHDGGSAQHRGLYGLAPEWADNECGRSCQHWVSACVLAHANAFGTPVEVSLRGEHPGLVWGQDEVEAFPVQEAAFYGNVFDSLPDMYACLGSKHAHSLTSSESFMNRLCVGSGLCDIEFVGLCHSELLFDDSDLAEPVDPAYQHSPCLGDAGDSGYFSDCRPGRNGTPIDAPMVHEVITVYLH